MTLLPFSSTESTVASRLLVSRVDAALETLCAELLALPLPGPVGEGDPDSVERALSTALNRAGCALLLLCATVEALDEDREQLVLDGAVYYHAGKSPGEMMSSFGRVRYERSQYRRRRCASVYPADVRFGLIGGFWSPRVDRQGSLSLAPVKDCEGLFRELGGMQPSATALNHLAETLGSAWDVVQEEQPDLCVVHWRSQRNTMLTAGTASRRGTRLSCVPSMLDSWEVKVFYPTRWR